MSRGMQVEELDEETRQKLGIPPALDHEPVRKKFIAFGKVIRDLKGLTNGEAGWVLIQALHYLKGRDSGSPIDFAELGLGPEVNDYVPPPDWVIQVVARSFGVKPSEVKQRGKKQLVVLARQVAMYILSMSNQYCLREIGGFIGGRRPATVSWGFQKIARRILIDSDLSSKIESINKELRR